MSQFGDALTFAFAGKEKWYTRAWLFFMPYKFRLKRASKRGQKIFAKILEQSKDGWMVKWVENFDKLNKHDYSGGCIHIDLKKEKY